MLRYKTKLDFV